MTYAFIKYWVEGTKEAAHQLYEAIANGEGWAKNSLENLGVNTEEYDISRTAWCDPTIEDRDGYSVVYFEEYYPYERGQLIDQLMEEEMFEDTLTQFCYYAEERDSDLLETNDGAGKYWPYRICIVSDLFEDDLYCRNKAEAVKLLHEQYGIPEEYKDLEAIKSYVEEQPNVEFSCYEIEIVMARRYDFSAMTVTEYGTKMTYAFIKYWVEGTKEAAHQLYEAIANGEGWAKNSLENLGIDTKKYDTARAEWCHPTIEDRDGYSVVYFEEYYPYERGQLIDQLMEEEMFENTLTQFCYYAEERDSDLLETNDGAGKYWPYRICIVSDLFEENDLYCRNEAEAVKQLHEQYGIPEEYKDLEAIKSYVEEQPDVEFICHEIKIV